MLLVHETDPGHFELTYMWLPTFIGMSLQLKTELEEHFSKVFEGKEATVEDLHEEVITYLSARIKIKGLEEYLRAVAAVEVPSADQG